MKLSYIAGIIVVAVIIGAIVSTYGDASTYVSFEEAWQNQGKEYHVVGELNHDMPMEYNPIEDPNRFVFYLRDENGLTKKVVSNNPKPADFERSEKVVIVGKASADEFHADKILLKCPSKYNEGKLEETGTSL